MQSFGILQVLHADFEAIGVGYAGPFNLRGLFLWHIQSSKMVLWKTTRNIYMNKTTQAQKMKELTPIEVPFMKQTENRGGGLCSTIHPGILTMFP